MKSHVWPFEEFGNKSDHFLNFSCVVCMHLVIIIIIIVGLVERLIRFNSLQERHSRQHLEVGNAGTKAQKTTTQDRGQKQKHRKSNRRYHDENAQRKKWVLRSRLKRSTSSASRKRSGNSFHSPAAAAANVLDPYERV